MKKVKKIAWITLFVFGGAVALFFIWRTIGYVLDDNPNKSYLFPQIQSTEVQLKSLSAEQIELNLDVNINNHFPFPFKVNNVNYELLVDGKRLVNGSHKNSIRLGIGRSDRVATLPMTIHKNDFKTLIIEKDKEQKDSVEYNMRISFTTNILGKREINMNLKRNLPLYHFPEIETEYLGIDSVNLNKMVIRMLVSFHNNNIFPLQTKNISYKFSIGNNNWIEGHIPGKTIFAAKKITKFEIPVSIPYNKVSKTLFSLLKKGDDLKYVLEIHFKLESDQQFISNADVILKDSRSVRRLLKNN